VVISEAGVMEISDHTAIKVGLLVAGGIVVNKLSEFVNASAPVILAGSLVVLISMLAYEAHFDSPTGKSNVANLVKFGLSSIILGALIGAVSLIPLFPSRLIESNWMGQRNNFTNYELLSAGIITLLSSIAAARRRSILQLATFLISAMTGMSLLVVSLKPGHEFTLTFMGWLAIGALVTAIIYWFPDIFTLYKGFWGKGVASTSAADQSSNGDRPELVVSGDRRELGDQLSDNSPGHSRTLMDDSGRSQQDERGPRPH
jgi:hypothetical protein